MHWCSGIMCVEFTGFEGCVGVNLLIDTEYGAVHEVRYIGRYQEAAPGVLLGEVERILPVSQLDDDLILPPRRQCVSTEKW